MTYEEVKVRLTKCEVKLRQLQDKNSSARNSKNYNTAVEKLTLLKESLQKQLKEAEETMFVSTKGGDTKAVKMDRKQAMDLKKDPNVTSIDTAKGQDLKEAGVQFSKEETAAIAKEVGKAVAKALHSLGDEIDSMKAKNLEPNSFEIYVQYKKDGSDDQFSFYISDDTLHLVDFSFDKEIGGVGVKPSGEAIVHVDVLANELVKHFKSLANEGMSDQEWADAEEADRLEKHPEKDTIKKIQALIAAQQKKEGMYIDDEEWEKEMGRTPEDTEKAIEKEKAKLKGEATKEEEEEYHEKLDALTHKTFGKRKEELEEAPEGKSYIKVAVRDARKALTIIDDSPAYSKAVEIDGSDTYYLDDKELAYDLLMDFGAQDIEVTDNNVEDDDLDDYGRSHSGKDSHTRYSDEEFTDMTDPLKRFARFKENKSVDGGGDLDIGHQDDEPDMLKQYAYDIATYAAKLYKQLDKYDQMDAEVDFPNWWQSKVILAKDYISKAQHYLEFEEKQPAIDQLALEERVVSDNEPPSLKAKIYAEDMMRQYRKMFRIVSNNFGNEAAEEFKSIVKSKIAELQESSERTSYNKLKKEYDALVGKMKQLAQHFKTAEGEKKAKIVAALKQHTARKRELESLIDQTVSGVGAGQELDPSLSELFGSKGASNYDELIGPIEKGFAYLKKYVSKKEPDAMPDLQKAIDFFDIFDEKMSYGAHMELEEALDPQEWFNNRHKGHREALLQWMEKDSRTKGKEVVDLDHVMNQIIDAWLKDYRFGNTMKGYLDDEKSRYGFWRAVQAQSKGELDEAEAKPIPDPILRGYNMNVKNAQTMAQALISLFNQINDKETMDFTKHSGMKRVLALLDKIAKTQDTETPEGEINEAKATCCGKCGRVHVKGTECKRPFLKGKDHCRYN